MIKYIKKISVFIVLTILLIPINANAKTLGQLKSEYNALEAKYNTTSNNLKATESQISSTKARVQSIYTEIAQAEKEVQNITAEISKLNQSILEKDKELKELMKFFQLSEGESTYLEYIFSAKSITDFIYRLSVTEQLSKYNDKLIDDMNGLIVKNKENINNLHKKEESLKSLQNELSKNLVTLAAKKESLSHDEDSIAEEIKSSKAVLDYYKKAGCSDNQDINSCAQAQLPPDTKFWRPLNRGWFTEEYGYRVCPVHGPGEFHSGVDLGSDDRRVYSVASGKVVYAGYSRDGYGNKVIIQHVVNGRNYSSLYGHLASINVSVDQTVTKDTVIGIMGNTGASAGVHLHLNIYNGAYPNATKTNPRNYINFPTKAQPGNRYPNFYDRTTYYN